MMGKILRIGSTLFWFIVGVAIFSRLVSTKQVPDLIRNAATAMQRLFNGAFGY